MKSIYFFLAICLGSTAFAEYTYTIQPRSYLFSTHYDLYADGSYFGCVENHSLQLRRIYSLCDEKGEIAQGTARLFSLGALFNSMREIDIYDQSNRPMGLIQGHWWTTAAAKFTFLNAYNTHFATAYVDRNQSSVNIVDALNERSPIAIMHRHYVPNGDYYWEVKVIQEEAIDAQMLQIFSAFITDACWPADLSEGSLADAIGTGLMLQMLLDDDR